MTAPNLKQKIRRGEQVVGVNIPLDTPRERFEAILAEDEYGFVFVDSQHSPYCEKALVTYCNTADDLGVPVRLRIKHTRLCFLIGNLLDLGPSGIEVPQVEEESTVREALESFYYPPWGRRSYGGGNRCGVSQFDDPLEYGPWWNEYGVLWMQLESVKAVTSAYSLAADGVDCLAFGPVDLAADLACHPHPHLKTVDDCILHVAKSLEGTGTAVSFRSGTPDLRARYADLGVTVFLELPRV